VKKQSTLQHISIIAYGNKKIKLKKMADAVPETPFFPSCTTTGHKPAALKIYEGIYSEV
jgi:hypothetical protein